MTEERKNYFEEMQERDLLLIPEIICGLGIPRERITLNENVCVFPYRGLWIKLVISPQKLEVGIYRFPEGSGYKDLLRKPFLMDDGDGRWKTVKEFKKKDFSQEGAREKAIKEILAVADKMVDTAEGAH